MLPSLRAVMFAASSAAVVLSQCGCSWHTRRAGVADEASRREILDLSPRVTVTASPGRSPGILFQQVFGGTTRVSTITLQSAYGFAGVVRLGATCCHDVIRNRAVPQRFALDVPFFWLPLLANTSMTGTLEVTTGPTNPTSNASFGKFLIPLIATNQTGAEVGRVTVGVRVFPDFQLRPACAPAPTQVFSLGVALDAQIAAAEAIPRRTSTVIALQTSNGIDTLKWTIADSSLVPQMALVELKNSVKWEKQISTAGCGSGFGNAVTVGGGHTGQITLVEGLDSTLVFRKSVGPNQFQAVAVFAESAFWSVFGGKKMTFEWVHD